MAPKLSLNTVIDDEAFQVLVPTMARGCHVCVCVPTFRRPEQLARLLRSISQQRTCGLFSVSILVVDDDPFESAKDVTASCGQSLQVPIRYLVSGSGNVAAARNAAVRNATGDLIAFIDDDEIAPAGWLQALIETYDHCEADGVLGPVRPLFDPPPPSWIVRAKLFERPSWPTGKRLHWNMTRSGNVLLRRSMFDDESNLFDVTFRHSEDKDFFRRATAKGLVFVWSEEAVVYEVESSERFTRQYFLKRALLRGSMAMRHRRFAAGATLKAAVAIGVYGALLPFLIVRPHLFMVYLIKMCDHAGAIAAVLGLDVTKWALPSEPVV